MDFELRWLVYESKVNPRTGEHFIHANQYHKLQYRTRITTMGTGYRQVGADADSIHFETYERPMGWTWSEWQDVPTVKELKAENG